MTARTAADAIRDARQDPSGHRAVPLREVAERAGCKVSRLVPSASEIDWKIFSAIRSLAITAGASAPEILVEQVIDAFAERYEIEVETLTTADETVFFPLPRSLRKQTAPA